MSSDGPSDLPDVQRCGASRRVHSVNFEPATDDWLESLVELLRRAGLPRAGRSEVVRVALGELKRRMASQSPADVVKYFLNRDVEPRQGRSRRAAGCVSRQHGGAAVGRALPAERAAWPSHKRMVGRAA